MQAPIEPPAEENTRLRARLNDLIRITAHLVLSTGGEPSRIAGALADELVGTLGLSFAFIRLNDPDGGPCLEKTRVAEGSDPAYGRDLAEALEAPLRDGCLGPRKAQVLIGGVQYSITSMPLGLQGELGVVLAGSQKLDFSEQADTLVLNVAASQATIGLQQGRLLIAQRNDQLRTAEGKCEKAEDESWRLIDSIPGPIATLTKTGAVEMVNRHLLEYFGTTVEEVRQWGTKDLVHPEDLPHLMDLFTRSMESGTSYMSEYRLRRSDGVYRWFQSRALPLGDSNGQIVRWCVLLTDIDDRKRAEDAVRASERNLKLIIDTIPAIAWSARTDGSADFFSQHYLDYMGLSLEQAKEGGWMAAVHPDDLSGLTAMWQRAVASEKAGEAEARLRRFDGSYRWFLFRTNPLRDEAGKIVKWYGANIDIEDRKQGEEALRVRETSWRQIVDNIPGLVVTTRAMGEVEFLNRQTLEYFGKTSEELKDWALIDAVHPDDLPRVVQIRTKSIETGQVYDIEHRCRRADGVYRWFQIRGLPVRNVEGVISDWYLLLTDIDDRKRAEDGLRASERNLSAMINAIRTFIFVLRPDGSVLDANQGVLDYTGVTLQDLQSEDYRTRFYHPEDVERLREERRVALTRPVPFENEQRCRGKDGQYRWFLARYNPVLDEQGNIDRWYVAGFDIDDRKWAEAQLKQAYLQLTVAQRLSKTGSFIADVSRDEYNFSEEALRIFEFDPATKVTQQMIRDRFHPEDLPSVNAVIASAMEGVDIEIVCRIVTSPGVIKHVRSTAQVIERIDGRPILRGALQDVTESKLAEEALRTSERNLSLMINAIPAYVGVMRADGSTLDANQAVMDYTGLTLEDVLKEDFRTRIFFPDDFERVREARRLAFTRPEPFENELRTLGKDGNYRWFLFRYKPQLDESGEIGRWYMAAFEIDDRKRAEAQVEEAYLRLAEAQRLSKTGSFITDLVADNHNWSEETYRIFEFDPATSVTTLMIRDMVLPEDLPTFDAVIARGIAGEEVDFMFRIVTSRGAVKHIRGMARLLAQIEAHPLFIGALQDVTDSKIAEEALDRARSELAHVTRVSTLNTFTASIAHEINQPLAGIITNVDTCLMMLEGDPPNVDGARETVLRAMRDGTRAADVIKRLRALYSRKELTLESVDLNEATREVIAMSLRDFQRNRVILNAELAGDLPPVTCDRVQIQQVILNILRNANDAMVSVEDRPRQLLVSTEREEGGHVRVTVRDSGVGIDRQSMEKLFDAFYTTKSDGMGIGLSVSRSIIERHRGRLWAEPNDGPGSTFSFSIPFDAKSADATSGTRTL